MLVFTRTKHGADRVVRHLERDGIESAAMHADKTQPQRTRALEDFKSGKVRVLVATDIAQRGLDISGISHVINYDVPQQAEDYVHRIGRTGRAAKEGDAFTFMSPDEIAMVRLDRASDRPADSANLRSRVRFRDSRPRTEAPCAGTSAALLFKRTLGFCRFRLCPFCPFVSVPFR